VATGSTTSSSLCLVVLRSWRVWSLAARGGCFYFGHVSVGLFSCDVLFSSKAQLRLAMR
jgi:hypothetical protein